MNFLKEIENANYLLLTEELIAPLGQVNLPSYAAPAGDKDDSPRYITWGSNGNTNALLDSVQSQNNRIEPNRIAVGSLQRLRIVSEGYQSGRNLR